MLFYVDEDLAINATFVAEMEKRLARHWGARIHLDLCNLAPLKRARGRWQEYISPALNIADCPPFQQTAQGAQVGAVNRMLSRKPDILFVHRLSCMIPVLLSKNGHPRIYFDLDDIEHVAFARSINQPPQWHGKPLLYLRLPVLRLWERRAVRSSHTTFVCSEHDRDYLSAAFRCGNVAAIPNAVEISPEQELPDKQNLLFLGPLSYQPNRVAADHLIRHIWPKVLSAIPGATLFIAGAFPERIESFADNPPGVKFLGFVDDLEKLYREVRVVCCPILAGGGTRIKILEAAAHGKPVVSTTIGAEGIDLRDGEEIFLRDDAASFAEACVRLLKEKRLALEVGRAGRLAIARHYERDAVVRDIRTHFEHPKEHVQCIR
jgi:glycosyltransferase involved in cell wall biosynthesis